jgi:hypothetical protein
MSRDADATLDELGVLWCAKVPQIAVTTDRVRRRLRRESLFIMVALCIGIPVCLAGLALGVRTAWIGWATGTWNFVTRGVAIAAIAGVLAAALRMLWSMRVDRASEPLPVMIDVAIARGQRALTVIRYAYVSATIALVLGLVGSALRIRFATAPRISPILDVAIVAAACIGLYLYSRTVTRDLTKLRLVRKSLTVEGDGP